MTAINIVPTPDPNAQRPPDTWKIERRTTHWTCGPDDLSDEGNWRQEPIILIKTARGWSDRPVEKP